MRSPLLDPPKLPWELRDNLTARSGVDQLRDGRTKYWVNEVLTGITPEMFVWWFSGGILGDMDVKGRTLPRYRVWHPYDHVGVRLLANRPAEASQGAVAELEEYFGRDPRFYTNPAVRIDQISEQAITTTWFEHGIAIGHLDHELEAVPAGMRLGHVMYVPGEPTTVGRLLAERVWPRAMGEAWIRHGIEEMGNFTNFLPQLYDRQAHQAAPGSPVDTSQQSKP